MIYFIQAGDDGPIKIGMAKNVELRLRNLQSASPVLLKMLAVFNGGGSIERLLHEYFSEYRLEGEWFKPDARILECAKTGKLPEIPNDPNIARNAKIRRMVFLNRKSAKSPEEPSANELSAYMVEIRKLCAKSLKLSNDQLSLGVPPQVIDSGQALSISWSVIGLLAVNASNNGEVGLAQKLNSVCSALARINKELNGRQK